MKVRVALFLLFLAGFLYLVNYYNRPQPMHAMDIPGVSAARAPQFGWLPGSNETQVMQRNTFVTWGPIAPSLTGQIKFHVNSSVGVTLGLMTSSANQDLLHTPTTVRQRQYFCLRENALEVDTTCTVNPRDSYYLLVFDARQDPGMTEVAGAYLGAKAPLNTALAENRVHVEIAKWGCVQNCPNSQ